MIQVIVRDSYFAGFSVAPTVVKFDDNEKAAVAQFIANTAEKYGRPEVRSYGESRVDEMLTFPRFSLAGDAAGFYHQINIAVVGATLDELRAAYRAAREPIAYVHTTPRSGDDIGDSRGDVGLCRGCGIETEFAYCAECFENRADQLETCGRCYGTGVYYGAGVIENGRFKGYSGVCYRCKGEKNVKHSTNVAGDRAIAERARAF